MPKKKAKPANVKKAKANLPVPIKGTMLELQPQQLILEAIIRKVPLETLEKLLAMRERLHQEKAAEAFRDAMNAFQATVPIIAKKKKVHDKDGKIRYRYAPLDDIIRVVQPYIARNSLSYDIETETAADPASIVVTVTVFHQLGHSKKTEFRVPVDSQAFMTAPQKWASAQTFAKRYAFCNAFGIMTGDEDDDARDKEAEEERRYADEQRILVSTKLNALPDKIKEAFKILGYTFKVAYQFCEDREWKNEVILAELNKVLDKQ